MHKIEMFVRESLLLNPAKLMSHSRPPPGTLPQIIDR